MRTKPYLPEMVGWGVAILLAPVVGAVYLSHLDIPLVPVLAALTAGAGTGGPLGWLWRRARGRERAERDGRLGERERADRAERALAESREAAETSRSELRRLRAEVDLLAAIREITLVANDHVDPERILIEVLRIAEGLFGSDRIAVFLRPDDPPAAPPPSPDLPPPPVLRAVRADGETVLTGPALAAGEALENLSQRAYADRRTARLVEGGRLVVATPLFADLDPVGVIGISIPGAGAFAEELASVERRLESLGKHLALALEKPRLYDRAVVDGLTRLFTKRHFVHQLGAHMGKARRLDTPLAVVLCDIDHFKKINDTHGHLAGDRVLAAVAGAIRSTIRNYDSAYRYGGEELAVVAPDASLAQARAMAERIRARIAALGVPDDEGRPIPVTASFGVAEFDRSMAGMEPLVQAADRALYEAKNGGRNRVETARPASRRAAVRRKKDDAGAAEPEGREARAGSACTEA